jgi:Tfp pilus assembly protein PilP
MKEKRTIILVVSLLALIGLYVWHSQRLERKRISATKVTRTAPIDPAQALMRDVVKAVDKYKKDTGTMPPNLEVLKGKYLEEGSYNLAKKSNFQYVYVDKDSYRINVPTGAAPLKVAAAQPVAGEQAGAAAASASETSPTTALLTTETGWKYEPRGKIDPFKPFIVARRAEAATPEVAHKPLTPLQKMALSEIQRGLKAIIWGKLGSSALVEDATGKGYVIKVGTYVGQNDGIVKKILEDRIIVEEYKRDPVENRLITNEVVLRLKKVEAEE